MRLPVITRMIPPIIRSFTLLKQELKARRIITTTGMGLQELDMSLRLAAGRNRGHSQSRLGGQASRRADRVRFRPPGVMEAEACSEQSQVV